MIGGWRESDLDQMKPKVSVIVATTVDGKITTSDNASSKFASRRDLEHLLEVRSRHDAILAGAKTIINDDPTFTSGYRYQNIRQKQGLPPKLVPVDDLVESLRMIKEPEEIEFITRAAGISDNAIEYIEDTIHAGMTEINVAWELEKILRENSSQSLPFDIIVASGPNAALPHTRPSQRTISPGEPVIIDIGARIENYGSDLSRTICLGDPDANFKKIYDIVHCAQLTAMAIIKEDMIGEQADSLARTVIEQAGYEENFGHALGHGIGLAPHESPRLGHGSTDTLASDMVFSIEPGIYLPGWGGVRIEDLVILEKGKVTAISKARKDLL